MRELRWSRTATHRFRGHLTGWAHLPGQSAEGAHETGPLFVAGSLGDSRKSREAGFNGHLVKPVNLAALMDMLAELLPTSD